VGMTVGHAVIHNYILYVKPRPVLFACSLFRDLDKLAKITGR